MVGFNYLFAYTSVNNDGYWSGAIATTTNFDDWGFTFGAGAGAVIRALEFRSLQGRFLFSRHVEVGARYLMGGTAEYLREGPIRPEHGSLRYETFRSDTNLLKTHFGIVFRF